jgi:hypothetical protein
VASTPSTNSGSLRDALSSKSHRIDEPAVVNRISIEASLLATFEHERKGMLAKTTLIYHQFPLMRPIIRKLSKFPPGFAEIPFEISLSENMIDFIEHNLEAIQHPPQGQDRGRTRSTRLL